MAHSAAPPRPTDTTVNIFTTPGWAEQPAAAQPAWSTDDKPD